MGQINYSKGADGGGAYSALHEGGYDFKINAVAQTTSRKGNDQIELSCEIVAGGGKEGRKQKLWYSLTPQSSWKLELLLEALEIERIDTGEVDGEDKPIMGFDSDDLIGRVLYLNATTYEYEGKERNDFADEAMSEYDPVGPATEAQDAGGATEEQPETEAADQTQKTPARGRRPRPAPAS